MRKFFFFFLIVSLPLFAKPSGFKPVAGKVKPPIQAADGAMVVESGRSAIVHWDAFSIGPNETVQFNQADIHSAILNRVVGGELSRIDGSLLSNGKVFLINQNGLLIGPSGKIVAASFIGSTLDLLDADFLAHCQEGKELLFQGSSENGIDQFGTILAKEGDCLLLAPRINQEGSIAAPNGHALLGAGQAILLRPSGNERIFIRVPTDGSIQNSGSVEALVTEIKCGVNSYSKAIQSSGKIEATRSVEKEGRIFLVAEGGLAEVSGQAIAKGGEIRLLGQAVSLTGEGILDVSGEAGSGGVVLIGGDFQGKNPEVLNAKQAFVGPSAQICAQANAKGDGGKVIVWGDETAQFYGNANVRGGETGGNGGFVEVSGKWLDFNGFADRRAPQGMAGELFLDPINITISAGADSNNMFVAPNYTFTGCPSNINTANLVTNIGAGNVTISTSGSGSEGCGQAGTITVTADVNYVASPFTLTLISDSDFTFDPSILLRNQAGTGPLNMTVGGNLIITDVAGGGSAGIDMGATTNSFVNVTGNASLSSGAGGISLLLLGDSSSISIGGDLTLNATAGLAGCGASQVTAGSITTSGSSTATIDTTDSLTINVTGDITSNSALFAVSPTGNGPTTVTAGGSINLNAPTQFDGNAAGLTVTAGQSISVLDTGAFTAAQNVLVTAGTSVTLANNTDFQSTSGNVTVVVDQSSALCGPGTFNIDATSSLTTASGGSAIRVFTSKQSQNTIDPAATFDNNGSASNFTPGPFNVDSATEQWSTAFPSTIGGSPFTIFYKEPGLCSSTVPFPEAVAIAQASVANTALTQILAESDPIEILTTPISEPGDTATPLAVDPGTHPINNSAGISGCY